MLTQSSEKANTVGSVIRAALSRIAQWLCHQEAGLVGRSVWAQSSTSLELTHSQPLFECEAVSLSLCVLSLFFSLSLFSLSNKHWLWAMRDRIFFPLTKSTQTSEATSTHSTEGRRFGLLPKSAEVSFMCHQCWVFYGEMESTVCSLF